MRFTLTILACLLCFSARAEPSVTTAFSPDAGTTDVVVAAIGEARHTIRLAAYSFTSKEVAAALTQARARGVDVEAVLDKSNATERYSAATFLADSGVPTRIDYRYAIMHDKFLIIDGVTVETGSFNYTRAAEVKNAENVIVLRDYPEVASKYSAQWQKLWNESEPYKARY